MKIAGSMLLLACVLLLPATAFAQEDFEDVSQLRREVRQLRNLVKQLTVDIVKLKARVRDLERRPGAGGDSPDAEAGPEPVTEEDWEEAARAAAIAGTYRFNLAATQKGYVEWRLGDLPEENRESERAEIVEEAREELENFHIELVLHPGGSLTANSEFLEQKSTATGTWDAEGNRVTLTITHENGEEQEKPDVTSGEFSGNLLRLRDETMPFPFVLERVAAPGGEAPADPEPESAAAAPPPSGGIVDTYILDKEKMLPAFEAMMLEQIEESLEGLTEEERAVKIARAKESAKGFLDRMDFEVNLLDDGSFTVMGENVDVRGTWEVDGEQITITTTYEDGTELDEPKIRPGRIVDGDIYFRPDETMPFDLILTRK